MTLEELKAEAEKLGYSLVKKRPPMPRISKCICGKWPGIRMDSKTYRKYYICAFCDISSVGGKTRRDMITNWNETIAAYSKE